jgi:hypothetical protein
VFRLAKLRPDWPVLSQICWVEIGLTKLRQDQPDFGEGGKGRVPTNIHMDGRTDRLNVCTMVCPKSVTRLSCYYAASGEYKIKKLLRFNKNLM